MRPRRCCRGSAQRSRFYPPFPLPLDFSLCLFLSATLSHCLSRPFVLSLFLSRCFHLSHFLHPPISFLFPLSFCLSLTLSLFLFLSVLLSRPLSSSAIYFSLSPHPLIVCFTPSLSLSLLLYSCLRRSHNSATELAIPQIVTASYRTIDSAVFLFFENLENFFEARRTIATRSRFGLIF